MNQIDLGLPPKAEDIEEVIKLKKSTISIICITIAAFLFTAGIVYAATTRNITSTLGGVSGDHFDVDGTMIVNSLKVGAQGVGGVTFFNGTIVNNTTDTDGGDNPVTFGDNVRIDGRVFRGEQAGIGDTMPVLVNDNLEVAGYLTVNGNSFFNGTIVNNSTDVAGNSSPVTFGDEVRIDGKVHRGATAGTGDTLAFSVNDNMEILGNSTVIGNETVGGNLTVTGNLTFSGNTPTRNKIYSATFDITEDGDEIATYDYGTDCVANPTYTDTIDYHYVQIAVPEASLTNPTNVQVYYKVHDDYKAGYLPDLEDLWRSSDPSITEGYLYLLYKYVLNICDGSVEPFYYVDGEYKALVTY